MRISSNGVALIKRFEGFSPKSYLCPAGLWTIGYGHVLVAPELYQYNAIDEAHAERLLAKDTAAAAAAVETLITVPLRQNQFDALVSFTFNLGSGALQRSTLRAVINRGEEDAVAAQWMRWVWGSGRKLPGLARRRRAELALYLQDEAHRAGESGGQLHETVT